MRKSLLAWATCVALAIPVLTAPVVFAEVDVSDIDGELMRNLEEAVDALDADISGRNAELVAEEAQYIVAGMKWTEEFFRKKGNADDAVRFAAQGHQFAAAILAASSAKDFDAAFEAYASLARTCRNCHDIYKP